MTYEAEQQVVKALRSLPNVALLQTYRLSCSADFPLYPPNLPTRNSAYLGISHKIGQGACMARLVHYQRFGVAIWFTSTLRN